MLQKKHKNLIPLLISLFLSFHYTSCSKKIYPTHVPNENKAKTPDYGNTSSSSDSKELKTFFAGGSGKNLETGKTTADDIVKTARKYMGTPHCMGGTGKKCIDCSGLVMVVFAEHGISLPHNSEGQARYGKIIRNKTDLRKGDLVFFIRTYKTSKYITHAGIYLGDGQMIHTSSSKGVMISSLDNVYWKDKFIFGTRVF